MSLLRITVAAADRSHLRVALAGLTAMNMAYLDALPPLYDAGVVYRPESPDEWSTADIVYARRYGDCEDLSAWRAAELRRQGIDARADLYPTGPGKWHAVVVHPDGRIEDPSMRLGMRRYMRRRRAQ